MMVLDSNIGQFDFSRSKVRLNGVVLDKYSLISSMRHLDRFFYLRLMNAYKTHSYAHLREILFGYLTEC